MATVETVMVLAGTATAEITVTFSQLELDALRERHAEVKCYVQLIPTAATTDDAIDEDWRLADTSNLSDPMVAVLRAAQIGVPLPAGPTRAALIKRNLVHKMSESETLRGTLTHEGVMARNRLREEVHESQSID